MNDFLEVKDWLSQRKIMTIEQLIVENLDKLRNLHPRVSPDESFDDILQLMVGQVARGEVTSDKIHDWWSHVALPQQNEDTGAFLVSMGCTLLAREELERGHPSKAWPLIVHAGYCCGIADGLSARQYSSALDGQASNGGNARAAPLLPLKHEIVRQLQDPPPGGWGKLIATAIEITERLAPFLMANPQIAIPPDLRSTLERWLKDGTHNMPIRQAYLSNRADARSRRESNP